MARRAVQPDSNPQRRISLSGKDGNCSAAHARPPRTLRQEGGLYRALADPELATRTKPTESVRRGGGLQPRPSRPAPATLGHDTYVPASSSVSA